MPDQDKKIMMQYYLYLILAGVSFFKFFDYILREFTNTMFIEDSNIYSLITISLFLIAGLLLVFASYKIQNNKSDGKFIGLVGIILFTTMGTVLCVTTFLFFNEHTIFHVKNVPFAILALIAFVLTIINWKKLP